MRQKLRCLSTAKKSKRRSAKSKSKRRNTKQRTSGLKKPQKFASGVKQSNRQLTHADSSFHKCCSIISSNRKKSCKRRSPIGTVWRVKTRRSICSWSVSTEQSRKNCNRRRMITHCCSANSKSVMRHPPKHESQSRLNSCKLRFLNGKTQSRQRKAQKRSMSIWPKRESHR